jgi:hypothetical protein
MYNQAMQKRSSKTPKDVNQLAKFIVDNTDKLEEAVQNGKNPAAVLLGRLGGLKGGNARAVSLSAEKRSEIAKKAANTRWKKGD